MSKLERYAHIAEIAGAITVVLSVLYLGYEIRRNTTSSEIAAAQNLMTLDQQLASWMIDPHINSIIVKARKDLASLSDEEQETLRIIVWSSFGVWEHAYFSHEKGVIDDHMWILWNTSFCSWMERNWLELANLGLSDEVFRPGFLKQVDACGVRHSPP
jgi:hypothetical protein